MGHNARNPVSGFANNKGADQPAHLHILISTFVIHLLKGIVYLDLLRVSLALSENTSRPI